MRVVPILFNTDMVREVLDDRKTATRRVVMSHNRKKAKEHGYCQGSGLWVDPSTDNGDKEGHIKDYSISSCWISYSWYIKRYALYKPGDIIYVRETWCSGYDGEAYFYLADKNTKREQKQLIDYDDRKWRPSIHMPKQAARIWLKVTDVRVERLQDITSEQIIREGVTAFDAEHLAMLGEHYDIPFAVLWDSTIKKADMDIYSWKSNPWVWVIEFERCDKLQNVK